VRGNASFKPQLDICSFPRRIPTPARVSLSRDFDGSRRDARQDVYEPHKNGKTRAALTLSKSFLIARVNDGGKILSSPSSFWLESGERVVITIATSVIIKTFNLITVKPNYFEIIANYLKVIHRSVIT